MDLKWCPHCGEGYAGTCRGKDKEQGCYMQQEEIPFDVIENRPDTQRAWPDEECSMIFLAGSIEQGTAEKWQDRVIDKLKESQAPYEVTVFVNNPRNENWDATWEQVPENPKFFNQVEWELDWIEASDIVFFWFDPKTKSPISLLELGLVLQSENDVIIYCPDEFWRSGNVNITAARFMKTVHKTPEAAIAELVSKIKYF